MEGKTTSNPMIFQIISNFGKFVSLSLAHRQSSTIQFLIRIRYGLMIVFKMWCAHDIEPAKCTRANKTNHHPVGYEYDLRNLL